jgi:phosphate/sulfate permease
MFGKRVIKTMGTDITRMTPSRYTVHFVKIFYTGKGTFLGYIVGKKRDKALMTPST